MAKGHILAKTNLLICIVVIIGFGLTAVLSYRANFDASFESVEQLSSLSADSIYDHLYSLFSEPVYVSKAMANDTLLQDLVASEPQVEADDHYITTLVNYLNTYKEAYEYDSVFLVSAATSRYYNFSGLDRTLTRGDAENVWYFDDLMDTDVPYTINVDNDEVSGAQNEITLFINFKLWDKDGTLLGVVGVGLRIDNLQQILKTHQDAYDINATLLSDDGVIEISTQHTGYENINLFEQADKSTSEREQILSWKDNDQAYGFWTQTESGLKRDYIVTRYLPETHWHLMVEKEAEGITARLRLRFAISVAVIITVLAVILLLITHVITRFNNRIVTLTRQMEQERQNLFEEATGQLFEDIYEIDITRNKPANQATADYFESLNTPQGTRYDSALRMIAQKQIKEKFRQGYLDMFLPENVLHAYEQGQESLQYEFQFTRDGIDYYWMRIIARIVRWESDGSVHLLVYRQNIDAEKHQQERMQMLANTDEMTGLLTKKATQRLAEQALRDAPDARFLFFIFDIDRFKQANDLHGHVFGDSVIQSLATLLHDSFRKEDIVGRIGGDEFAALVRTDDETMAERKASAICEAFAGAKEWEGYLWRASLSIGIAISPRDGKDFQTLYKHADIALYNAKREDLGSFTVYQGKPSDA